MELNSSISTLTENTISGTTTNAGEERKGRVRSEKVREASRKMEWVCFRLGKVEEKTSYNKYIKARKNKVSPTGRHNSLLGFELLKSS